ncbi:RNA polymerase-binding protein DksA [Campylobacter lanienae]|uniref:putative barnase/colicin E5 family endoribonuclease n=1 Tax=Campylobacter lanienae TaxID=75658 RepID=UPI000BB41741|nr:RNA polymerase-binding protein DksA [Campylobacter lanienae]
MLFLAEFILLNRAILNANGDFKLAIKNIDNIPGGNLPTPTRNLLNEFKNAVKEIEKRVVKADNQPNLANQANSGNIDSLTKQISYLQNAIKNSTKEAPTPSTATKEADSLSEATQNLTQNSIKGDGFVTYPNSARQETAINQNLNIQEWVKNMSGVISDEWRANLTKLAKKHPEMFRSEVDVFRVIKEIKDNPTHFFKNYDDDVALIGKQINDNKFANIGIVKNDGEIIHANKNRSGDLDRLQRKQLKNYEKDGAIAGTPAPATTRPNNGVEGEIIKNRTNAKTIPNQSIKEAKTAEPTPQATKEADKKAKLDEELAKNKAYVEGLEREAINKIEALHNFNKTKVKTEVTISSKSIISQAEQELKEFAKSIGNSQEQIDKFSLKGIQHLRSYLNDLGSYFYRTKNQRAQDIADKYNKMLDDMAKIRATKKDIKSQKDEQRVTLVNEAIESFRKLWFSDLKSYSNFLIKYGKTDEFMTKANPKWKSEFDEVRASMERKQNIEPIKEFGTNYAEFYRDGQNAIKKLLVERQGQVAGAFHKDGRDITISWGEAKMANGDIKGYGLSKIEAKHLDDFAIFEGSTPQEKMANGINEIIEKGKIVSDNGIDTIWYKKGDRAYIVGLSKGFNGVGDTSWVVTSYEKKNVVGDSKALSANAKFNEIKSPISTNTETIPNQSIKEAETAKDPTADAPSELYKAHRKAQKAKETLKPQEPQAKSEPMATQITKTKATTKAEPAQETFDILKIDKNISDEQVETLLKEIEDKNLKVNLPLRDEEALGKAFQKDELGYGRKRLFNLALNEQFLKRHKGFIERAEKNAK